MVLLVDFPHFLVPNFHLLLHETFGTNAGFLLLLPSTNRSVNNVGFYLSHVD